jgi:hypothetical protein
MKVVPAPVQETPQTVKRVTALDAFLVEYVDGDGKVQTRVAFRIPKSEEVILVQERIQGNHVVVAATNWFKKAFCAKIDRAGKVESV